MRVAVSICAGLVLVAACAHRGERENPAPPAPFVSVPIDAAPDAPPDSGLPGDPARGFELTMTKGCLTCHSPDGTEKVGPSWLHAWGSEVTLEGGRTARVDADYIRRALQDPEADRVAGFVAHMPSYAEFLTDAEIDDLIAYIASLK